MSVAAIAPSRRKPLRSDAHVSCLYEGSVRHRRTGTPSDEFHYPLFMAFLDLDELPELFDGRPLWSARRPALAWFRRGDYLGDASTPLREAVGELVAERTGIELDGPVRLLTHLRYFGHCFNPVSFYYCYDAAGERVRAVVAEVTNTPWGERHAYVLPVGDAADRGGTHVLQGQFAKVLHVSPLMGMNQTYDWRLSEPSERISVHIESLAENGKRVFDATLSLCRSELTPRTLRRALLRYPALTMRLTARIYAHALRLRLRGAKYHPHPERSHATSGSGQDAG
ncbi:MAG TPA: DUF1365 domain-containing protein [Solirubrobacteraceae bacterium]|nr:DUF1365 domain-containing protein [Solirubrobacteraceae bacterium]